MRRVRVLVLNAACGIVLTCRMPTWAADTSTVEQQTLSIAASTTDDIARRERDVSLLQANMVAKIEFAVSRLDVDKLSGTDKVLRSLRPLVHQLNADAKQILANQDKYFESLRALYGAVSKSPAPYRAASRVYDAYAYDEPYDELKQDYRDLADSWRLIADEMDRRADTIRKQGLDAVEFKRHFERTSLFLERLETHLASFPEVNGQASDEYSEQLQRYIQGFESLRGSLRTFHDKLKASSPPTPESRKASSTVASQQQPTGKREVQRQFVRLRSAQSDVVPASQMPKAESVAWRSTR
jgi:hypothetical protein